MDKHAAILHKFWAQDQYQNGSLDTSMRYKLANTETTEQVTTNLFVNVFEVFADGRTKRDQFNKIIDNVKDIFRSVRCFPVFKGDRQSPVVYFCTVM